MSRRKSSGRGPAKAPAPLILVVDDYADNREMYSAYLKFQGLEVVEAANGAEALERAFERPPDLVVMDLSLPGVDGWQAYWKQLKNNGVQVVDSWEQAYNGSFTAGGSSYESEVWVDLEVMRSVFRREGVELMFAQIKAELHAFGVDFDVYFHENTLHESGAVERAIARLTEMGNTYESGGALWLRTEKYGDDKDRVIIKSDGEAAYISGDLAYYLDKRERGFDLAVIMLGADHHGYVGRMMAMCQAFGDKPHENLEILIGQMVNLVRDGQPVRMSKRAGTVVTMEDMVEAIGVDAARYALVRYSSDSNIDIDLELWGRRTSDNPVFYVQYAHARLASILRNAADLGIKLDGFEPGLLSHDREGDLLRALAEFPQVVASAAELKEPHRVARYLESTASAFHKFYDSCRVLPRGDEELEPVHKARLTLVSATKTVLANGLDLLGVSAPERM